MANRKHLMEIRTYGLMRGEVASAATPRHGSLLCKMKTSRLLVGVLVCGAMCAAGVEFPSSGGDISSPSAWGSGGIPTNQDIEFRSSGTYVASNDLTFATISLYTPAAIFDFAGPNGTAPTISCSQFSFEAGSLFVTLSDGGWTSSGKFYVGSTDATVKAKNNTLILTNGVSVSAAETYVSNKQTGNTLKVCDGSTLSVSGNLFMGVNPNGNNRIEITSGGTVSVGQNFQDGSASSSSQRKTSSTANSVLVGGMGSQLSVEKSMTIGSVYCDNSVVVTNGAGLENGYRIFVGSAVTATNNSLSVIDGASVSGVALMIGEGSTGNVFRVSGASTATFTQDAYLGGYNSAGYGNSLEIEDSDFTCRQLIIGRSSGMRSTVRISGKKARFEQTRSNVSRLPLFVGGGGHEFILDGASWHHSDINLQFDDAASDSTVSLVNGASFVTDGGLYFGTNSVASCGNTLYIGDGSCFTGQFMRVSRQDNSVVISNGCCALLSDADSNNTGLRIGDLLDNVNEIGGNRLTLQGRAPKVRSAKDVRIARSSTLLFEIPSNGLDCENVPVVCSRLVIDAESSLRAAGVAAFRQSISSTVEYTLVEASGANMISVPASVLSAANDDLVAQGCVKCEFRISADGSKLSLKVRPTPSGTYVTIR